MLIAPIKDSEQRFMVWFWNRHCAMFGRAPVERFRSRAVAMRRISGLVSLMRQTLVQYVMMPDGWMPHPLAFEREYVVVHHPVTWFQVAECFQERMLLRQSGARHEAVIRQSPRKEEAAPTISSKPAPLHPMVQDIGVVSVMLDGAELGIYASTYEAFKQLGLPNARHIQFRAKLKQVCAIGGGAGTALFEHDDKLYKFIVKKDKQ